LLYGPHVRGGTRFNKKTALFCMTLFQAIIIGIVQGLTEFLPISSTAHMRIVPALLGWEDPGSAFSAVIQIGTLAAVVAYFWRDLWRIAAAMVAELRLGKIAGSIDGRLGWMIIAGTVPIVVAGLLFEKQIDTVMRSLYVICASLIAVAILLAIAELLQKAGRQQGRGMNEITWRDSILIGLAQAVALIPGTSRSGVTLLGGLACGLNRETAARYSFLLSVPAVFAAGVYKLIKERDNLLGSQSQMFNLIAGLIAAAIVGYLSIDWLLRFLRKRSTFVFIAYRIALAVVLLILLQANKLNPMPDSPKETAPSGSVLPHLPATNL
jgi:undecaprenyl-diphosphatase